MTREAMNFAFSSLAVLCLFDHLSAQAATTDLFWGCGLLGKTIRPSDPVWKALIADLQKTSSFQKVATWNWDIQPQSDDLLNSDFMFFPNVQCAGTSADAGDAYLSQTTKLPGGIGMASLALGGNEPDQVGYCQNYTDPDTQGMPCNGFMMRNGTCTGTSQCFCKWDPTTSQCQYDVTGCGMWPVGNPNCTGQPFPFWCFGKAKKTCRSGEDPAQCCSTTCHNSMLSAFSDFFVDMAYKGYTYATTPIVASDLSFIQQLMDEAGCGSDAVKGLKGQERLKRGCPTHSAFHFYTSGCPTDPDKAIQGFVSKVNMTKHLNTQFALEGAIVNEIGALRGNDTHCTDDEVAAMMSRLFDYLKTPDGTGVVSQMMWFNEDDTGGTFDLRLIKDGTLSKLGETYTAACKSWAESNGVVDEVARLVV